MQGISVFSGQAHPLLAQAICDHLGTPLSSTRFQRFSNDCMYVQLLESCRERDVFVIQPIVPPVQENLMELLLMLDAARGASARRVTAVIPHYAYARSDKKDSPRISITGRLVADMLVTAGANRVLTLALHSEQVHGFFSVPVDHMNALKLLAEYFSTLQLDSAVVVSPDLGNAKEASKFARILKLNVAAGRKQRLQDDKVVIDTIVGDVSGRDCIVMDDEIATGSSILELLDRLRELGARRFYLACTHGLFTKNAIERLAAADDVIQIVTTDSVPIGIEKKRPKLVELSTASLLSNAIRHIHLGESVSGLFV